MPMNIIESPEVQALLHKVAGLDQDGGDPRIKAIVYDLTRAVCEVIDKHDITEDELWGATSFAQRAAPEFGLIMPGIGIEHFMDLALDARDKAAGVLGGTPRTIEGPLFVEGAPLTEGSAQLNRSGQKGIPFRMEGTVFDGSNAPVAGAIIDVWHANENGAYSIFDGTQPPFNFRAKIKTDADGRYAVDSVLPVGYSCPPGGSTEQLLDALGRHGSRPAHVHFFVRAPGFRALTTQINIADDPLCYDDFAFATREGLVPPINREDGTAFVAFDFELQSAADGSEEILSARERRAA